MKEEYPTAKADLMAGFMVRAQELTAQNGTWAMINLPSWMSLKSFKGLRQNLLKTQSIVSVVQMGRGIFGSDFGSVGFVIDNVRPKAQTRGVYRRLFEKHVQVRTVTKIESLFLESDYNRYAVEQRAMDQIEDSPIIFWLSEKLQEAFQLFPAVGSEIDVKIGMRTGNNERFLRFWWEVSRLNLYLDASSAQAVAESGRRWVPFNKGGTGRRWYGNQDYVVNWKDNGREIKEATLAAYPSLSWDNLGWKISNESYYFSPSVSWSDVSSGDPAFRYFPSGFIFDSKGNCMFTEADKLPNLLAVMNSNCVLRFLEALTPTVSVKIGDLSKTPLPDGWTSLDRQIPLQLQAVSKKDWDTQETSWNFSANPLVRLASSN